MSSRPSRVAAPLAINIVERSRSAGAGVTLSAQSAGGLGEQAERERLLASAAAVILFRSPMPAELAAPAGSGRTPRRLVVLRRPGTGPGDDHRAAPLPARPGPRPPSPDRVAEIISAGRVERAKIIRTAITAETHSHAGALLAAGPSHPLEAPVETPRRLTNFSS